MLGLCGQAHARQVDIKVQDTSGATIPNALGSAHCPDGDFDDLALRGEVALPDGEECELTVRAHGFAEVSLKVPAQETTVVAVLGPGTVQESVTVTASRSPLAANDLPVSEISKTRTQLVQTAAVTTDDKLRQVPGFSLFRRSGSQTANPTSQGVSLRGLGASGASRSLVLEDGVPINDPFGGWVYWGRVPVDSIESVDVVEGGTSDLYGSNALGGVINVKTRSTLQSSFVGETSFGSSSSPLASGSGTVRLGNWAAMLAGEIFDTNGYISVPEESRGAVDTPVASQHRTGDLLVEHATQSTRIFLRGNLFGESRDNGTVKQFNDTTIRQLATGADLQNGWGAFRLRAFGGTQNLHQTFSAVAADRNSETLTTDQRVPVQQYGFTAQWSRLVGGRHLLAVGVDGRDITGDTNEVQHVSGKPTAVYIAGGRQQTLGIFAEDVIQVTNRWLLSASVRGDVWKNVDASSRRLPFLGTPALAYFQNRSEMAVSPRAGVTRIINQKLSAYASVYRSFRAPTLNELYRPFRVGNVQTQANADLQAEHFTGGEAGVNVALSRRVGVKGAFFAGELTNAVGNITLSSTPALITRQRQNLGQVSIRGFEIQSRTRIRRDVSLALNYQFINATVVDFKSDPTLIGTHTPQVPRHSFSFQATYANPKIVTVAVQGRAVGQEFDDDRNTFVLDPYFNLGIYVSRNVQQHVAVFVAAENALNSRYAIAKTPLVNLASPVTVRVGIRFEVGRADSTH